MDKKVLFVSFVKFLFFLVFLFFLAGRVDYWQGWVFVIVMIIYSIMALYIFRNKMDLFEERLHPGKGVKWWDKVFFALLILLSLSMMVISVLDSGRYHWTQNLPLLIYFSGSIVFIISMILVSWSMYVNKWFSSMVRIQKDRGQKVCSSGPYRFVRHPGYFASLLMFISMPVVLGSYYGIIPGIPLIILFFIRTYLEDETLKKELKGYKEFTKKTKYRLIPFIW